MIQTYHIKPSDIFSAALYPHAVDELMNLKQRSLEINSSFKEQVVISFLKDHRINSKWLESDRDICKLMTSGDLKMSHVESLFNAGRLNVQFLEGLETYIKTQLGGKH